MLGYSAGAGCGIRSRNGRRVISNPVASEQLKNRRDALYTRAREMTNHSDTNGFDIRGISPSLRGRFFRSLHGCEQPVQLVKETRTPLPMEPGKPE